MRIFIIAQVSVAVMVIFFISYTFFSFYKTAKSDAFLIGEKSVYEVGEKLNNFLLNALSVLNVTCDTVDFMVENKVSKDALEFYLVSMTEKYKKSNGRSFLRICGLIDGKFINESPEDFLPGVKSEPKAFGWYISAIRAGGAPVISFPYKDPVTGDLVISISRMLSDHVSVISTDISISDFQSYINDLTDNKSFGFIMDKNSFVVAHTSEDVFGKNILRDDDFSFDMKNLVGKIITSASSNHTSDCKLAFEDHIDGNDVMAFSMTVRDDWFVVMVIDSSRLFSKIQFNYVFNIVGFILLIAIIIYYCTQMFIGNLKLESKVEEQVAQMVTMQNSIIEELATLIESRDANTGEHVKNTRVYSLMIAKRMYVKKIYPDEVTKTFIRYLRNAAPLHDVGKITVPDSVLCKPGQLSDFEYEVMKNHTRIGGAIIRKIFKKSINTDAIRMAVEVAQYHHERWDGNGYPLGMREDEIPLSARILAVADCFDALVSQRCYKKSVPASVAFNMINAESGTHFDPIVVQVFMSLKSDVIAHLRKIGNEAALQDYDSDAPGEVRRGILDEVIPSHNLT